MQSFRKLFHELGFLLYVKRLNTGDTVSLDTRARGERGPIPNITLLATGKLQVQRPNGEVFFLDGATSAIDTSYVYAGFYTLTAVEPSHYICLGPIPTPTMETPLVFVHEFFEAGSTHQGFSSDAVVMAGSLRMQDDTLINEGDLIPKDMAFEVITAAHVAKITKR